MSLLDNLKWRYATKKMNGEAVPQEKLEYILEAARLAPSSSGLQPYEILVISNRELLEQLKPFSYNQEQITDCSHLLVWAAWDSYSLEKLENEFHYTLTERQLPLNQMDDYKNFLWSAYEPLGKDWHAIHTSKQAYISFAMAIAAAAEQKVDATPMEGFNPVEYDKILGLTEKGLKSAVILPIGFRDSTNDWNESLKKVRKPFSKLVTEIK
ncbi:nitroreductase family protein [Flavobacterium humi]|uniref:NAD(P)H-dependent oxidoreductase n=1 Tax=Flavobacterium humi TaxID=2562683 RepID=A0A4Z0LC76_9FLAO|nr:nitroreductase family protein [Flavobacterium humi]TGD59491.1 NAD(P)H-dependent oxidoreductase [Flavobacterium humi]